MLESLCIGAGALGEFLQVACPRLSRVVGVGDVRTHADEEGGVFVVGIGADLVGRHVHHVFDDVVEGSRATVAVIEHVGNPRCASDEARCQRRLLIAAVGPDKLVAFRAIAFGWRLIHVIRILRTDRLVVVEDGLETLYLAGFLAWNVLEEQAAFGDFRHRLFPGNGLPLAGAARSDALHRMLEPGGTVERVDAGLSLGAQRADVLAVEPAVEIALLDDVALGHVIVGVGVVGVAVDLDQLAVLYRALDAATAVAHQADTAHDPGVLADQIGL